MRRRFICLALICAWPAACGTGPRTGPDLCGNGELDPGESCDDGNRFDGDNCPADCVASTVAFDVDANHCPELLEISIFPSQAALGAEISLSALARDADGDRIYYDYTGAGGYLTHALHSKRASYVCGYPGEHELTLWMFDSKGCVTTAAVSVTCQ